MTKVNKQFVKIEAPVSKVFAYTLEPKYIPFWIDYFSFQDVDTDTIGLGTRYRNDLGIYEVVDYQKNAFIEFFEREKKHRLSFSFKERDGGTELTFFEYREDEQDLENPIHGHFFQILKENIESEID